MSLPDRIADADTTGDGVPDENVPQLYANRFEADEAAATEAVHRMAPAEADDGETRGEHEAIRVIVAIAGDADVDETTDGIGALWTVFKTGPGDAPWATSEPKRPGVTTVAARTDRPTATGAR